MSHKKPEKRRMSEKQLEKIEKKYNKRKLRQQTYLRDSLVRFFINQAVEQGFSESFFMTLNSFDAFKYIPFCNAEFSAEVPVESLESAQEYSKCYRYWFREKIFYFRSLFDMELKLLEIFEVVVSYFDMLMIDQHNRDSNTIYWIKKTIDNCQYEFNYV